jgi:hypothetical protein
VLEVTYQGIAKVDPRRAETVGSMLGSIRRIVNAFGIASLLVQPAAHAGDWTPKVDRKYRLVIAGSGYNLTEGDRRWAENLVARLREKGGMIESFELVPAYRSARLEINGASAAHKIFRQPGTSRYLVVSIPDSHADSYLVDFERR